MNEKLVPGLTWRRGARTSTGGGGGEEGRGVDAQAIDNAPLAPPARKSGNENPHSQVSSPSNSAGSGTVTAQDAQGTPTQSHISQSILVHEDNFRADSGKINAYPQMNPARDSGRNTFC